MAPQYDLKFKKDSINGQIALQQSKDLQVGQIIETRLMAAIPENVKWTCVEATRSVMGQAGHDIITLSGKFCGLPLYTMEIRTNDHDITLKVKVA